MKYTDNLNVILNESDYPDSLKHLIPYFKEWCFLNVSNVYQHAKNTESQEIIDFVRKMYLSQDEIESFIASGDQEIPRLDKCIIVDLTFTASDALDASAMLLETKDETGDFRDRFRKG